MSSLPLLPDSGPRLVGIARLASHGESVRKAHEIEYFTLPVKSLLNRCTGSRMPFTWTINPYRGCEFACKYCYARYTHEFMEMRDGIDFEQKIYAKQHAADLLRQELRRVKPGEDIALGTATDPYQPIEKKLEITRAILEEFAQRSGLEVGIVTKSAMVARDIDVLREVSKRNRLAVNITVTTTDTDLARILEPRAPRPDLRLDALKRLREAGIRAGVICAPVLPGITDSPRQLEDVVRKRITVERVLPLLSAKDQERRYGAALWQRDPDLCCQIRKIEPLRNKLSSLRAWITAIRRTQTEARAAARKVQLDSKFNCWKINPLVDWTDKMVWAYIRHHKLAYNPLHDRNFASIGCTPCTRAVRPGEDPRAGRWPGLSKTECGIHSTVPRAAPNVSAIVSASDD